jgi:hypothetical protein
MLFACASSPTVSQPQTKPQLDSSLAKDCAILSGPELDDYDAWLESYLETIRLYSECAVRHRKTVQAWPK